MFEMLVAEVVAARTAAAGLRACARLENAACAARLSHMADLLAAAHAEVGSADREQWRLDNWGAVCAQIGAAHEVTSGVASGLLMDAVTLRERLPRLAAVFAAGDVSYRLVHVLCARTLLIQDRDALAAVDAELAEVVAGPGALSVGAAERAVDAVIARHDPFAVRRTRERARGCRVEVHVEDGSGVGYLEATVLATDAKAAEARIAALAATPCPADPRTVDQRRAAAVGAMAFGWDRLPCLCETEGCAAASRPAGGGVIVHVIARQDALDTQPPPAAEAENAASVDTAVPAPEPGRIGQPARDAEPGESKPPVRETVAGGSRNGNGTTAGPSGSIPRVGDLTAQRRALSGARAPLLPKPWFTYTLTGLSQALAADPGEASAADPGVILGGAVLPAAVIAHAVGHARIRRLIHPGQAPPQPRYRPSRALAEFVRCRDLTCRFPGCARPATVTDLDHTVAWPVGPTCASNLKCLCREHHLLKTFWPGWRDEQFPDGTVVWTAPDGQTYRTTPGSALLFPELCHPTAPVALTSAAPGKHTAGLTMPRRPATRAAARRQAITDERHANAKTIDREQDPSWWR